MTFSEACALLRQNPDSQEAQALIYQEATRIGANKINFSQWGADTKTIRDNAEDIVVEAVFRLMAGLKAGSLHISSGGEASYFGTMVTNGCRDSLRRRNAYGGGRRNTVPVEDLDVLYAAPRQGDPCMQGDLEALVNTFREAASPNMAEKRAIACDFFLDRAQENNPPTLRKQVNEGFSQVDPDARRKLYDAVRHQTELLEDFLKEKHHQGQI